MIFRIHFLFFYYLILIMKKIVILTLIYLWLFCFSNCLFFNLFDEKKRCYLDELFNNSVAVFKWKVFSLSNLDEYSSKISIFLKLNK
jgi:hypothetical protein